MKQDPLFPRTRRAGSVWTRPGFRGTGRRAFDAVLTGLVVIFVLGWSVAISEAAAEGRPLAPEITRSPLASGGAPETAFLLDEVVRRLATAEPLRGRSGAVRVVIPEPGEGVPIPDSLPEDVDVGLRPPEGDAPDSLTPEGTVPIVPPESAAAPGPADATRPGVWALSLRSEGVVRTVPGLRVLTQLPLSSKREGRIGRYLLGDWPFEGGGTPPSEAYETPRGVVRVDPEAVDLPVSDHFTLGDFLTKGQADVWPKYAVVSTRLLDKLELVLQEMQRMGHEIGNVGVISGFRTPHYNETGGDPSGRGSLSRHMYGDAMDFYIDNDGDACMDDLTGDGAVDVADARVLAEAANRVERRYPDLVGGIGVYQPTSAHCGFVHVDTRGYQARW